MSNYQLSIFNGIRPYYAIITKYCAINNGGLDVQVCADSNNAFAQLLSILTTDTCFIEGSNAITLNENFKKVLQYFALRIAKVDPQFSSVTILKVLNDILTSVLNEHHKQTTTIFKEAVKINATIIELDSTLTTKFSNFYFKPSSEKPYTEQLENLVLSIYSTSDRIPTNNNNVNILKVLNDILTSVLNDHHKQTTTYFKEAVKINATIVELDYTLKDTPRFQTFHFEPSYVKPYTEQLKYFVLSVYSTPDRITTKKDNDVRLLVLELQDLKNIISPIPNGTISDLQQLDLSLFNCFFDILDENNNVVSSITNENNETLKNKDWRINAKKTGDINTIELSFPESVRNFFRRAREFATYQIFEEELAYLDRCQNVQAGGTYSTGSTGGRIEEEEKFTLTEDKIKEYLKLLTNLQELKEKNSKEVKVDFDDDEMPEVIQKAFNAAESADYYKKWLDTNFTDWIWYSKATKDEKKLWKKGTDGEWEQLTPENIVEKFNKNCEKEKNICNYLKVMLELDREDSVNKLIEYVQNEDFTEQYPTYLKAVKDLEPTIVLKILNNFEFKIGWKFDNEGKKIMAIEPFSRWVKRNYNNKTGKFNSVLKGGSKGPNNPAAAVALMLKPLLAVIDENKYILNPINDYGCDNNPERKKKVYPASFYECKEKDDDVKDWSKLVRPSRISAPFKFNWANIPREMGLIDYLKYIAIEGGIDLDNVGLNDRFKNLLSGNLTGGAGIDLSNLGKFPNSTRTYGGIWKDLESRLKSKNKIINNEKLMRQLDNLAGLENAIYDKLFQIKEYVELVEALGDNNEKTPSLNDDNLKEEINRYHKLIKKYNRRRGQIFEDKEDFINDFKDEVKGTEHNPTLYKFDGTEFKD